VTVGRLCDAVEQSNLGAVREMLRRRPEICNLERPGHGEHRALHVAVLRRDAAMVRLLMENGADARRGIFPHRDATSALRFAVERGYDEIAALIHEEEQKRCGVQPAAGVGGPDRQLLRQLDAAMRPGDQERTIALLEADAELVRRRDPDGWTALHRAAGMLREHVVEWLVENGADVNPKAKGDWTPLDFAASGRLWDEDGSPAQFASLAKVLVRAGAAVALGDADWVRARHADGALANAASFDVFGPFGGLLTTAVTHDRPEMLKLLLDLGLDPDERTRLEDMEEVGYSWGMPLHGCAGAGKFAMAEMLLARGADRTGKCAAPERRWVWRLAWATGDGETAGASRWRGLRGECRLLPGRRTGSAPARGRGCGPVARGDGGRRRNRSGGSAG